MTTARVGRLIDAEKQRHEWQVKYLSDQHKKQLEETKRAVAEIVERGSRVDFDRDHKSGHYQVTVRFDPNMMGGLNRYATDMIAEYVARDVHREIASCRFIESAKQREREREEYRLHQAYMMDPHNFINFPEDKNEPLGYPLPEEPE